MLNLQHQPFSTIDSEATYTFFLFGNRTKRPKITDGWKVTNQDRPTPQESYGQQHHG